MSANQSVVARLNAVTSSHAGNWLSTITVRNCGLDLSNEAIRVTIGLHLGLNLCTPTPMSVRRDRRSKSPPRTGLQTISRKISKALCRQRLSVRALTKADTPCTKEPPSLIRTDGKRPDVATIIRWATGKYIAGISGIHTCATSYLHLSSSVPGGAARHAADRKRKKYVTLPASREFVPIAVETLDLSTVRVASSCWNFVAVELGCRRSKRDCFPVSKTVSMHPAL